MHLRYWLAALAVHLVVLAVVLVGVLFHPVHKPVPIVEAVLVSPPKIAPKPVTPAPPSEAPVLKPKPPEPSPPKSPPKEPPKPEPPPKPAKPKVDVAALRKQEEQERQRLIEQEELQQAELQKKRDAEQRQQALDALVQQELEARMATERDRWALQIQRKVQRNWIRPNNIRGSFQCRLDVQILPGGAVANVELTSSCGNASLDESVKRAVWKSDPLPLPSDPSVFVRQLNFTFVPEPN